MNRWWRGFVGLMGAIGVAGAAAAEPAGPSAESVTEWLTHELDASRGMPDFGRVMVSWVREDHWYPQADEMARLGAEVPGHPDHPERFDYARYVLHKRGEPTLLPRRAWILNQGTWRLSEDLIGPPFKPGSFWDKVVTPHLAFSLCHDSLSVMDPTEGYPPGQNLGSLVGEVAGNLNPLLSGGLCVFRPEARIVGVTVEPDGRWVAHVRLGSSSPAMLDVGGRWDASAGRGFVESIVQAARAPGERMRVSTAADWSLDPTLNRWIAGRVSTFDEAGRLKYVYRWVEAQPLSEERFAAVFVPPSADKPDAVRGPVSFKSTFDMVTGVQAVYLPDGHVLRQPIAPSAPSPNAGSTSGFRAMGWAIPASALLLFGWLVVRGVRKHAQIGSV